MGDRIKVIVVDDQSLYREGLVELIKKWDGFEVAADLSDGKFAIEECGRISPDIVLMDVKMPKTDGIEACQEIHRLYPNIAVVMLSLYGDKERVLSAVSSGARGYLVKSIHARQLHQKLLSVYRGGCVLSDEVTGHCIEALQMRAFTPVEEETAATILDDLTEHEIELLRLITNGASNRDIAGTLYISESTVKKQVSFVLTKLGFNNRVQAAVFALRSGIAR